MLKKQRAKSLTWPFFFYSRTSRPSDFPLTPRKTIASLHCLLFRWLWRLAIPQLHYPSHYLTCIGTVTRPGYYIWRPCLFWCWQFLLTDAGSGAFRHLIAKHGKDTGLPCWFSSPDIDSGPRAD